MPAMWLYADRIDGDDIHRCCPDDDCNTVTHHLSKKCGIDIGDQHAGGIH